MTAHDTTTKYAGYARGEVLVTLQWLEEHLRDPALRVVEVDVSPAAYDGGHIDGAVLWNVYSDLKDSSYRLAGQAAVESLLTRSGISPDSTVVLYGYAPAMGLWLLKLYGHADVRILDCARGGCTTSATRPASPRRASTHSTATVTCATPSTPTRCCAGGPPITPAPASKPANAGSPTS